MKHNSGWRWSGAAEEKGQCGVQTHVDGRGPAINAFLYNSLLTAAACTGHHRPWRPLAVTNGAAFLQPTSNHLPAPSWHSLWCFTFTASWRWGFCSGSMMISFLKLYFNCQSALAAQINHHTPYTIAMKHINIHLQMWRGTKIKLIKSDSKSNFYGLSITRFLY